MGGIEELCWSRAAPGAPPVLTEPQTRSCPWVCAAPAGVGAGLGPLTCPEPLGAVTQPCPWFCLFTETAVSVCTGTQGLSPWGPACTPKHPPGRLAPGTACLCLIQTQDIKSALSALLSLKYNLKTPSVMTTLNNYGLFPFSPHIFVSAVCDD